jgi:hypothetical protein
MNPYDEVRTLHSDTVVGTVEGFEGEVSVLVPVENDQENLRRSAKFCTDEGSSGPHKVPAHLLGLINDKSRSLTDSEREDFRKFLIDHQSAFSKDEWDLGQTSLLEHEIPTGDSKPVKQPPRQVPIALAKEERNAIMNIKERGIIQPSTSPWSSPLILAGKKNGATLFRKDDPGPQRRNHPMAPVSSEGERKIRPIPTSRPLFPFRICFDKSLHYITIPGTTEENIS